MTRTYAVTVTVEIDDPAADDPDMEFAAVALAVADAARILTARAEGFDDGSDAVSVAEVLA